MISFSAQIRLNDHIAFEDLRDVYNISSNYITRDNWYVINEDYFQIELLGYG